MYPSVEYTQAAADTVLFILSLSGAMPTGMTLPAEPEPNEMEQEGEDQCTMK